MKFAFLTTTLCATIVLVVAAPIKIKNLKDLDIGASTRDAVTEKDIKKLLATGHKKAGIKGDKENDTGEITAGSRDIPIEQSMTNDDKKGRGDDTVKDISDISVDEQVTNNEKDRTVDETPFTDDVPYDDHTTADTSTGDSQNDLEAEDSSNDRIGSTSAYQKISSVVRLLSSDDDFEKNNTMEVLPEMEKAITEITNRKRYVKQSFRSSPPSTSTKSRRTVIVGVSKDEESGATTSREDEEDPRDGTRRSHPEKLNKPEKREKPEKPEKPEKRGKPEKPEKPEKLNKPATLDSNKDGKKPGKTNRVYGPAATIAPNQQNPKRTSSETDTTPLKKNRSTTPPPKTIDNAVDGKTCSCIVAEKPKMECYSFTNESKGTCRLRMCGTKWTCLASGKSSNICIRKYATEKVELVSGTNKCRTIKHPPKAYWVFYRKYGGPSRS